MTPVSHGKPCAGNPHARFDEGASASEEQRRKALLHNKKMKTKRMWMTRTHPSGSLSRRLALHILIAENCAKLGEY